MTITLTYFNDLSRVEIALSGYADGAVDVERSTNQLFWQKVRGGIGLPIVGGVATLNDYDGFVPDVQNFYRTVSVDPPAGLLLPGTAGSYASTPDTAALDIVGDIDLQAEISPTDWSSGADQEIVAKYETVGNQRSYRMFLNATGQLSIAWSTNGTSFSSLGRTLPETPERMAVRINLDVNNGASGHTVRWWTAPAFDETWEIFDIQTVVGTTSIFAGTATMTAGARGNTGATGPFAGTIHGLRVYSGFQEFSGTLVANPDFAAQDTGDTSFVDGAGRTWTINGTAEIRGEVLEVNSITPNLQGQIWLKVPELPFLNQPVECVLAGDVERPSRVGIFDIKGRSVPVAVSDLRGSQQFGIAITTTTLEQARNMDLTLAVGKTMLLHVPQEDVSGCGKVSAVPGGFVEIGDTVQRRGVPGGRTYQFTLPCVVVAPPGPDVIPTTLIWGTVFNLWGGWDNLIASNPTWADLLATVGSVDDPVVL